MDLAAKNRWTPIQIAKDKGDDDMVELLLSAGADEEANKHVPKPDGYRYGEIADPSLDHPESRALKELAR